jgi:hypothetical protein
MHMTAARLNAIEKLEPSRMPVMTVRGRMRGFYNLRGRESVECRIFGDCALDRKALAI